MPRRFWSNVATRFARTESVTGVSGQLPMTPIALHQIAALHSRRASPEKKCILSHARERKGWRACFFLRCLPASACAREWKRRTISWVMHLWSVKSGTHYCNWDAFCFDFALCEQRTDESFAGKQPLVQKVSQFLSYNAKWYRRDQSKHI